MSEINKEKFGLFLSYLRKEKGMTQKQLADKIFVSDKAVSKWERGLSLPDISLLIPLAELFEVSVTELLEGEKLRETESISREYLDEAMYKIISMKSKSFLENLFHKKESIKKSYVRILLVTMISVVSTFVMLFGFHIMVDRLANQAALNLDGRMIAILFRFFIFLQSILILASLWWVYERSICYLFSIPIHVISLSYMAKTLSFFYDLDVSIGGRDESKGFISLFRTGFSCGTL